MRDRTKGLENKFLTAQQYRSLYSTVKNSSEEQMASTLDNRPVNKETAN